MSKRPSLKPAEQRELEGRTARLRQLLGEAGYKIFEVEPLRRRSELDLIVLRASHPTAPVWIYPSRTGRLILRPWTTSLKQTLRLRQDIPKRYRAGLRMLSSRPMPKGGEWHEWLSPAARAEARLLRVAA